ncbi:MAG: hypothetical protein HYZ65_00595 [Burkholderiales bacterium]|nr:hypothetical protein [Burkholderiales bacterium]
MTSRPLSSLLLCCWLSGCSALLPSGRQEDRRPWASYQQAQQTFADIKTGVTTLKDLQQLGLIPDTTPNITLLNHVDLGRRLGTTAGIDLRILPPELQLCLASHTHCYAMEIEEKHLERNRYGGFWSDFLNFERKVQVYGWQFNALIILQNDLVVYKLWSGKPNIEQQEQERSPLGPLQGLGTSLLRP